MTPRRERVRSSGLWSVLTYIRYNCHDHDHPVIATVMAGLWRVREVVPECATGPRDETASTT